LRGRILFLPTLLGSGSQKNHEYLYWELHGKEGRQAVRKGKWKAVAYRIENPKRATFELFDLDKDPSESHDIASQYPEVEKEIKEIISESHVESEIFPFK